MIQHILLLNVSDVVAVAVAVCGAATANAVVLMMMFLLLLLLPQRVDVSQRLLRKRRLWRWTAGVRVENCWVFMMAS